MKRFQHILVTFLFVALYSASLFAFLPQQLVYNSNQKTYLKKQQTQVTSISNETIGMQLEIAAGQHEFVGKTPYPALDFFSYTKSNRSIEKARFLQYASTWQNQLILQRHKNQLYPHHHFW